MNANELDKKLVDVAKFIDIVANNWQVIRIIESTRTMLRQQQAEIERLSNDNYKFIKAMANKDSHIESLKQLLNDSVLRKAQKK